METNPFGCTIFARSHSFPAYLQGMETLLGSDGSVKIEVFPAYLQGMETRHTVLEE